MAPIIGTLLLGGCGGGEPPPKPPTPVAAPAAPAPGATGAVAVRPLDPGAGPALPPLAYDAKKRRDPFSPIVRIVRAVEAPGLNVTGAKRVGVGQSGRGTLALVEAAGGVGYILKSGDVFGNGRVIGITGTTVTFAVPAKTDQGPTTVTLRLALD